MEVVVTTGAATRRAKLQSNHHHQQTNTQLFTAGCPSCRPTNSVRALKERWLTNKKFINENIVLVVEEEKKIRTMTVAPF